jgi:hypothetical protein
MQSHGCLKMKQLHDESVKPKKNESYWMIWYGIYIYIDLWLSNFQFLINRLSRLNSILIFIFHFCSYLSKYLYNGHYTQPNGRTITAIIRNWQFWTKLKAATSTTFQTGSDCFPKQHVFSKTVDLRNVHSQHTPWRLSKDPVMWTVTIQRFSGRVPSCQVAGAVACELTSAKCKPIECNRN